MALTAGKTWTMTIYTDDFPGYGQMYVTWTFQQYYDVAGNYSQIYLVNTQCYHSSGSTAGVWVTSRLSCMDSGWVSYGSLGGGSIDYGITYPLVTGAKIYHDEEGNGSVTITAGGSVSCGDLSFAADLNGGSQTTALYIPRASELSVAAGTLGTAQTLTVVRYASSFTHTITYTCGSASGTVCSQSGETSIAFTPPVSLAAQNTTGTTVTLVYTLTTYSGTTVVGSKSYTVIYTMPASVKPTVASGWATAAVENTGAVSGLTCYVQGYSKATVTFNTGKITMAYGATIASYKVVCGSQTITASPYTTAVLTTSGAVTLTCTVTDSRGRSTSGTVSITVQPYAKPTLSGTEAYRSDSSGTASDAGLYIAVKATATISSLSGQNTQTLRVRYKTGTGSYGSYTTLTSGTRKVIGGGAVAVTSSYIAEISLVDKLGNTAAITLNIPTESVFFAGREGGTGAAFGKHTESDTLLDVAWHLRARKNLTVNGTAYFTRTTDLAGASDNRPAVIIGPVTGTHLEMDGNEIIAKSDATTVSGLYLGPDGCTVYLQGKSILNWSHPVGSIYLSVNSTSPASLFGGTWTQLKDRFLLGAGSTYTNGATGGAATHALTYAQNASHRHQTFGSVVVGSVGFNTGAYNLPVSSTNTGNVDFNQALLDAGGGIWTELDGSNTAHNNMPPYLVVYMWKRTA